MTGRPADPLALLTGYVNELFVDGDADATWTAEYAEAKAALAAVERLVEAARVPLFLACITDPPCGDCPGCRLRDAIAPFDGGEV